MQEEVKVLLDFWFGDLGYADLPNSDRTNLWFGENKELTQEMLDKFGTMLLAAEEGKLNAWSQTARGRLALIILFDQFSRHLHRQSADAFKFDLAAQKLCQEGITQQIDHTLTLVERVFFYMPLVHAENIEMQEQSIRLYQQLVSLALTETTQVYQLFLAYAYAHFRVIKEFGRFPQRNELLQRQSTSQETAFLENN